MARNIHVETLEALEALYAFVGECLMDDVFPHTNPDLAKEAQAQHDLAWGAIQRAKQRREES